MINKTYAIAFVVACALGAAFGTSPMAAEAVHGAMTYMNGCAKATKGDAKCAPPAKHVVGSANGHPEMKQAQPQDHAINTKGTGSTRVDQGKPQRN